MLAHDAIVAGSREVVLAGGMESMTNAPYLLGQRPPGSLRPRDRCTTTWRRTDWKTPGRARQGNGVFVESCAANTALPANSRTPRVSP